MLYTADKAMRLDEFVKQNAQMTRSRAQKLIEDGHVLVDGVQPIKAGQTLKIGQSVSGQKYPRRFKWRPWRRIYQLK